MQQILALTPDLLSAVQNVRTPFAHAAYRIGCNGKLWAAPLPTSVQGGWMLLSDPPSEAVQSSDVAVEQIARECSRRHFCGVIADFEAPPDRGRVMLLRNISRHLSRDRCLMVPERYADAVSGAAVLISTAISGGSLQQRLEEAIRHWGAKRIVLDAVRLRMDFTMPSPRGEGTFLRSEELFRLQQGHSVFFSPELCARYFTYRSSQQVHFVLFDDAETLRRKEQLGASLGLTEILYMLPEVADITEDLFPKKQKPYPKV